MATLLGDPACTDREQRLTAFATTLSDGIGAAPSDTASFLDVLSMFTTGGDQFSMRAKVIEDTARPVLQRLGVAPGLARTAFLAAYDLVYEAVLSLDPNEPDVVWMGGPDLDDTDRSKRTITRERLLDRLRERGIAIPPDAGIAGAPSISPMVRKLRAGRLGPTVIASAPRLRRRWYELEAQFRPDIPGPMQNDVRTIRAEVLQRATIAESRTRRLGESYGTAMHNELSEMLSRGNIGERLSTTVPDLMGCALQLTDECEIWWSDEFDPRYEAPWLLDSATYNLHEHAESTTSLEEIGPTGVGT